MGNSHKNKIFHFLSSGKPGIGKGEIKPKKDEGEGGPKKDEGKGAPKKDEGKGEPKKVVGKGDPKKLTGKGEHKKVEFTDFYLSYKLSGFSTARVWVYIYAVFPDKSMGKSQSC